MALNYRFQIQKISKLHIKKRLKKAKKIVKNATVSKFETVMTQSNLVMTHSN